MPWQGVIHLNVEAGRVRASVRLCGPEAYLPG